LGFNIQEAQEIISWINTIKLEKQAAFGGKRANHIKASLTYIGGRFFLKKLTQRRIAHFYGIPWPQQIQISFKPYLKLLQQAKPDLNLKEDFRSREVFEKIILQC
jgi:hypothetical protein